MGRYAEGTKVPVERSVEELRRTVERYGGAMFTYGISPAGGVVQFAIGDRWVKFSVARGKTTANGAAAGGCCSSA